ncbi:MAG: hypothetical protein KBF93_08450 [Leptospiraceae bacterium]|nr:hypothetical protein [Leptospiraceae bacterium]
MGRTVAPYSMAIESTIDRLKDFEKALRKDDREIFQELMRYAKTQTQTGVMASNPNPFDSMSLTMHIQIAKKLKSALEEIEILKSELKALKNLK